MPSRRYVILSVDNDVATFWSDVNIYTQNKWLPVQFKELFVVVVARTLNILSILGISNFFFTLLD